MENISTLSMQTQSEQWKLEKSDVSFLFFHSIHFNLKVLMILIKGKHKIMIIINWLIVGNNKVIIIVVNNRNKSKKKIILSYIILIHLGLHYIARKKR